MVLVNIPKNSVRCGISDAPQIHKKPRHIDEALFNYIRSFMGRAKRLLLMQILLIHNDLHMVVLYCDVSFVHHHTHKEKLA